MSRRRFVSGGEWQAPHWSDFEGVKAGPGTLDNVAAPAGRGPRAMLVAGDAAVRCGSSDALDLTVEAMVYRAYFYLPALPSVEAVLIDPIGVGITFQVRVRPDGRLAYFVDGSLVSTPVAVFAPLESWFLLESLIELKTDTHPGMTAIRLNGHLAAPAREHNFESFDPHSEGPVDERADFGFRYVEEPIIVAGTEAYVTDIAIADSDAGTDRRWTGTGRVEVLRPDGLLEAHSDRTKPEWTEYGLFGVIDNSWNTGTTYNATMDAYARDRYASLSADFPACLVPLDFSENYAGAVDEPQNLWKGVSAAPPRGVQNARGVSTTDGPGSHREDQITTPIHALGVHYGGSRLEPVPGSDPPRFRWCTDTGTDVYWNANGTDTLEPIDAGEWFELSIPSRSGTLAFYQTVVLAARPEKISGDPYDGLGEWAFWLVGDDEPMPGFPGYIDRSDLSAAGDFPAGWKPIRGLVERDVVRPGRMFRLERTVTSFDGLTLCAVGITTEGDLGLQDPFPDLSSPPSTVTAGPPRVGVRKRPRAGVGPSRRTSP